MLPGTLIMHPWIKHEKKKYPIQTVVEPNALMFAQIKWFSITKMLQLLKN